ncbi:MAG: RICIN domain-containing protein [Clostridia bacterium]
MMKRILSFLLAFAMIISAFPSSINVLAKETVSNLSLINYGSSGNSSGTGILVATGVYPGSSGTSDKAPYIADDTGSFMTNLGSTRIGVMAFSTEGVSADTVKTATLNVYVNFVNGNIGTGWLRFAAYETDNPSLTYSVGGMNQALFPAKNNDYSYNAAMWSNERFTNKGTEGQTAGWATIDVTRAVKNAVLDGKNYVVLRFQVPTAGINLSTEGDYAPFIELVSGDKVPVTINCVDENDNVIKTTTEYILEGTNYKATADTYLTLGNVVYTLDGESEQEITVSEEGNTVVFNYTSSLSNVMAKYEFEDSSFALGDTVTDSSGNGYDGSVAVGDLSITDGVYGNGINLNSNGYIELPSNLITALKELDGFTVSALVKKNALQHQFLFSASAAHLTSGSVSLGIIDAYNYRYEANGDSITTGKRTETDSEYAYLTASLDFANGTGTLYIDGVQVGSGSISKTLTDVGATVMGIGVSPYNDGYYNGYIDQFEIYNKVLSSSEVSKVAGLMTITPVYTDSENNRSYRGESITARIGESVTFEKSVKDNTTFYNFDAINEGDLTTTVVYAEGLSYDYIISSTSDKNAAYKLVDSVTIGGECSEYDITLPDTVEGYEESQITWSYDSDYVTVAGKKATFEKKDYTYTVTFTATIEYQGESCTKDFKVLVHAEDCTPTSGTRAFDINGLGYTVADGENLIDIDLFDYTCNSYTGWTSGGAALTDNFSIAEGYNDCGSIKAASLPGSTAAGSINPYIPLPEHTGEEAFIISFAIKGESNSSIEWSNAFLCDEGKNNTGFVCGTYDGTNYRYGINASQNWSVNRFAFTPGKDDKYIRLCIGWTSNIAIDNISIVKAEKHMIEVSERYVDNLTVYDEQTVLGEGEYSVTLQYGEKYISEQVPESIEVDGVNYILVSNNSEKTVKSDTNELTFDYRYIDEKDKFLHPGILNTDADLTRIAEAIANEEEPYYSAYQAFTENTYTNIGTARAVGSVNRGGTGDNCALLYHDAARAYFCAIRWKLTGDTAYGDCARDILNAWSATLKSVGGTSDRYLLALYFWQITAASELMREYPGFELERMQDMLYLVCYKNISEKFLYSNEYAKDHNDAHVMNYWANWDLCNMAFAISLGVFCDRRDIYDRATEYYKNGAGNGSIFNAVPKLYEAEESELNISVGQWQEAGRDMPHAIMGIGQMAVTCEVAWNQGDDLYGWANNRFMYGAEYLAQAQMGHSVPFTTYYWYSGNPGTWSSQTAIATGDALRPVFEIVYNHYAKRKGYELPGVKEVVDYQSPEGGPGGHSSTFDQFGFGTLLYTRDEGDSTEATVPKSNVEEGYYRITSKRSGHALTVDSDGYVKQYAVDDENENQLWQLVDLGGGIYKIVNVATGKVMSIENNSYDLGALLTTSDYEGKYSQQFAFLCMEDDWDNYYAGGYYKITNVASGLGLDVLNASYDEGASVLQYTYNSGSWQQWDLIPAKENGEVTVTVNYVDGDKILGSETSTHIVGSDLYDIKDTNAFYIKFEDKAYIVSSEKQSHTVTLDDEGKTYSVKVTVLNENAVLADTFASFDNTNKNNTVDLLFAGANGVSDAPDTDDDGERTVENNITCVGSARIPLLTFNVPRDYTTGKAVKLKLYVAKANGNLGVNNNMKIAANTANVTVDESTVYTSSAYADLNSLVWSKTAFTAKSVSSDGRNPVNEWVEIDVTEFIENAVNDKITFAIYAPAAGCYIADREKAVYGGEYEGKAAYLEVCDGWTVEANNASKITKNGSILQNSESFVLTDSDTVRFYSDNNNVVAFTNGTKVYKTQESVAPEEGTYTPATIGVYMIDGAQVRIGDGVDENGKVASGSGLRFVSKVDRIDSLAAVKGAVFGVKITAEGSEVTVDIPTEKWQTEDVFTTAITNLNECNYNREFTATPYIIADNQTFEGENTTRSIYRVAAGILINGYKADENATEEDKTGTTYVLTKVLTDVLNAYVNQVGLRLTMTNDGTFTARVDGTGAYTGDLFFEVSKTDNGDGSYKITITPSENVEIKSWWKDYVRINNNNSAVKNMISEDEVSENGILTFKFTLNR